MLGAELGTRLVAAQKRCRRAGAGAEGKDSRTTGRFARVVTLVRLGTAGVLGTLISLLVWSPTAFAAATGATGATGSAAGSAPGLSVFSGINSWIDQYGLAAGAPTMAFGGLMMAVEHHQGRLGNAIRAKGYITSAAAGLIVMGFAPTAVGAVHLLAH